MEKSCVEKVVSDVPTQVFERFLEALMEAGVPDQIVSQLRRVLLEERSFTERALKEALLSEEPLS